MVDGHLGRTQIVIGHLRPSAINVQCNVTSTTLALIRKISNIRQVENNMKNLFIHLCLYETKFSREKTDRRVKSTQT